MVEYFFTRATVTVGEIQYNVSMSTNSRGTLVLRAMNAWRIGGESIKLNKNLRKAITPKIIEALKKRVAEF